MVRTFLSFPIVRYFHIVYLSTLWPVFPSSLLQLALNRKEGEAYSLPIDLVPPVEGANIPEVTPEQRAENDRRMAQEDSIRNAYVAK